MNIEDVITQTIVAVCKNRKLSKLLILKGGGAMRLFDSLDSRLSIDADFSVRETVNPASEVFSEMKASLENAFTKVGYSVIDFRATKRPSRPQEGFPDGWGGWTCDFKLVDREHDSKSHEAQRRYALIPTGATSPKITIDLSECEYCGKKRSRIIRGAKIQAYSREMLVLEKIRAICQQHPDYPYRQQGKNRARDFYDIYELTTTDIDEDFIRRCRFHLKKVFSAKEVSLQLLNFLWSESFIDELRRGFGQVKDTVKAQLLDFDVYVEHLRFFILEIYPEIHDENSSFSG